MEKNNLNLFRAWNGEDMDMYAHNRAYFGSSCENGKSADGWVVMQCTGEKDKNGKDVYDGDIILNDMMEKARIQRIGRKFIIALQDLQLSYYNWESDGDCNFQVIGNIYENPELLVDSKRKLVNF